MLMLLKSVHTSLEQILSCYLGRELFEPIMITVKILCKCFAGHNLLNPCLQKIQLYLINNM